MTSVSIPVFDKKNHTVKLVLILRTRSAFVAIIKKHCSNVVGGHYNFSHTTLNIFQDPETVGEKKNSEGSFLKKVSSEK